MKRRGYLKFEEFNNLLLTMMENNNESVYDSYSSIIEEMGTIE
jgi:hypothetical protein